MAQPMAKRLSDSKKQVKELNIQIKEQNDLIGAMQNELAEVYAQLNKWQEKQANGYSAVKIENGVIVDMVNVPPGSIFTYTQPIPRNLELCKFENGKIEIDNQKLLEKGLI